ncbi:transmembrane protein 176 isoform X2 [Pseudorasbora parva]|uniref:transmembrane protein 176 isoform X2 n=1 Tax=Pseudorasbora parva TaxID=51549 RepID=UPI00351E00D9
MTLTLSTDLSVTTGPTQVEEKLEDKRQSQLNSIKKGEPKIFGVSQIVIGLLIISYSIPLLSAENTMILNFGVPWWSGLMFVISGTAAIALEKNATVKTVSVCLAVSVVAVIISTIGLILYYVDIAFNPATICHNEAIYCDTQHYATLYCIIRGGTLWDMRP